MSFSVIPAIDLIEGKCVRLTQGDYTTKKVYHEDPLEIAKSFEAHGVVKLHLVDLDGAKAGRIVNYKVIERIASKTNLSIDFGGGLKSDEDLKIAFDSGAKQITGGSVAVKNRSQFLSWLEVYGDEKIILGADAKDRKIAISGWLEESDLMINTFIGDYLNKGIKYVISTDIAVDGMLTGPSIKLYSELISEFGNNLHLIASGGIKDLSDLEQLKQIGCSGAILGKAIYENRITLKELENFILNDQ